MGCILRRNLKLRGLKLFCENGKSFKVSSCHYCGACLGVASFHVQLHREDCRVGREEWKSCSFGRSAESHLISCGAAGLSGTDAL